MRIQILVIFYQIVLKVLSGNEVLTWQFKNQRKMTSNNPYLGHVNINAYTNLKLYQLVLKTLSGNENLTSIKAHFSITNLRKMMCNNLNIYFININVHTKFSLIISIISQDTERKQKSEIHQGP